MTTDDKQSLDLFMIAPLKLISPLVNPPFFELPDSYSIIKSRLVASQFRCGGAVIYLVVYGVPEIHGVRREYHGHD